MTIGTTPPIGTIWRPEFRDLDPKRLPVAPPRPGAAPIQEAEHDMNKTQKILAYVKAHATDQATALKPSQIGSALGGESQGFDTSTVNALLRTATRSPANAGLYFERRELANYWWWGMPAAEVTPDKAEKSGTTAPSEPDDQAQLAPQGDKIIDQIAALPTGCHIPEAAAHAARLRELAAYGLLAGPVADWLHDLAKLIEGGAA